ncbi:MAG: non-canonical purine NTP pyrophosphatase, partial [Candidatus Margulisbacteria bacterium]|nr:non-canonical purine NTP pyrophosphatase [Candidatus Margulisiibacteriota bacterium]
MGDDSGLMVDYLKGAPGIKSARYAGPNPTKEKLCKKLLKNMQGAKKRSAKFVCCVAIAWPDGKTKIIKGEVRGRIINEMRGQHGFGYDPVFVPLGYSKTFAEMKPSFKNKISHRAKAFRKVKQLILC